MTTPIEITPDGRSCACVAASLLARMAYPREDDSPKREAARLRLHGSLLRHLIKIGGLDPDSMNGADRAAIRFLERSRAGFISLERRLRHRLAAGNCGAAILFASHGLPVRFPKDFGDPTMANVFAFLQRTGGGEERNIEARTWSESLPVLNLAMGLSCLIQQRWSETGAVPTIYDIGADSSLVARWIRTSNALAPAVEHQWRRRGRASGQPIFTLASQEVQKLTVPPPA